ncbi:hypothetical protein BH11PLA1_BH11PLA1_10860 [soil metagenome]
MRNAVTTIRVFAVALALAAGTAASAQSFTPLAFGPLGAALPAGQYYTSTIDISGDGLSFVGVLNNNSVLFHTPGANYTLANSQTYTVAALARDGQTVVGGGAAGATTPQRWNLGSAVGTSISPVGITWPGGPVAYGAAYGVNSNATVFSLPTPTAIITPTGYTSAQSAFNAADPFSTAGALRGIASDAPIEYLLGHTSLSTTNGYRWNFSTGAVVPMTMPAGASSIEFGSTGNAVSADGLRVSGSASIGGLARPCWWDASGTPQLVPMAAGAFGGSMNAMNYTGTLGGGAMNFTVPTGNRAFMYALDSGTMFDLNQIYSAAGLLPAGWTLRFTQHISDDGNRIFCLATAPDGSTQAVLLTGNFNLPTPGAATTLALGGVFASRRRRRPA